MPTISRFYGILIRMYHDDDHAPPHLHAVYSDQEAAIGIDTLEVLRGELPGGAPRLVQDWASLHREELLADRDRVEKQEPLFPIDPLD